MARFDLPDFHVNAQVTVLDRDAQKMQKRGLWGEVGRGVENHVKRSTCSLGWILQQLTGLFACRGWLDDCVYVVCDVVLLKEIT